MEKFLQRHRVLAVGEEFPGAIVISPTLDRNIGHVGIVGAIANPRSETLIYSNSSSQGKFSHTFTLGRWQRYFTGRGLQVLFYGIRKDLL